MKFYKNRVVYTEGSSNIEIKFHKSRFGDEYFIDVTITYDTDLAEQSRVWMRPRGTDLVNENDALGIVTFIQTRGRENADTFTKLRDEITKISTLEGARDFYIKSPARYSELSRTAELDRILEK